MRRPSTQSRRGACAHGRGACAGSRSPYRVLPVCLIRSRSREPVAKSREPLASVGCRDRPRALVVPGSLIPASSWSPWGAGSRALGSPGRSSSEPRPPLAPDPSASELPPPGPGRSCGRRVPVSAPPPPDVRQGPPPRPRADPSPGLPAGWGTTPAPISVILVSSGSRGNKLLFRYPFQRSQEHSASQTSKWAPRRRLSLAVSGEAGYRVVSVLAVPSHHRVLGKYRKSKNEREKSLIV